MTVEALRQRKLEVSERRRVGGEVPYKANVEIKETISVRDHEKSSLDGFTWFLLVIFSLSLQKKHLRPHQRVPQKCESGGPGLDRLAFQDRDARAEAPREGTFDLFGIWDWIWDGVPGAKEAAALAVGWVCFLFLGMYAFLFLWGGEVGGGME